MDDKKQTTVDEKESAPAIVDERTIRDKIYLIRGQQVMLDSDLAAIYGYETKALNQQVRRNIEKFDDDFRFHLTKDEAESLKLQNVTSSLGRCTLSSLGLY